MNKSILIACGVALAAIGWVVSGQFKGETPAGAMEVASGSPTMAEEALTQVRVLHSVARDHESVLILFGRTEGERSVQVKVETSGRIEAVVGVKGKTVNKGDVIAGIAMADRQARLKEAQAMVERYAIAFEAATKLSQKQFRSKVQLAAANADLVTAEARLRSIRVDIERTTLRAPFTGVLDDVTVDVGDYVAIGDISATVVDLDPILIVGEVTGRAAGRLKVGDKARVTLVGMQAREGLVSYISKVGSVATRTFRIEITVANSDAALAEGMTAELKLQQGRIKAHFVSPAVLTLSDLGALGVKVVGPGDVVQFYPVTIVDDTPQGIWLTGLPDETAVIVVGQEFVRSGQKVQGTQATPGQPS